MLALRLLFTSFFILLYGFPTLAAADSRPITTLDTIEYFQVPHTLSLDKAQARFQLGDTQTSQRSLLSLGISDNVTWVQLSVTNHGQRVLSRRLTVGKTWIDHINVYLFQSGLLVQHWETGDSHLPADEHLVPGLGYTISMKIPPGKHHILISASSNDPMTLPIQLLSPQEATNNDTFIHFSSAFVYGILASLIGFNLVLYITLKQPYPLFYCLYISCFICVNITYNGYGFAWIYPNSTFLQDYATLALMILHGISGVAFVVSYLDVSRHIPKIYKLLIFYSLCGIVVFIYYVYQFDHINTTRFAFSYLTLSSILMIITGLLSINKIKDAKSFSFSVLCSMVGLLTTTFTIWGFIPYNYYTYHGAVLGVLCEAIILAIIITIRLKDIESERIKNKHLSCYDPLTNLYNRRAFYQYGHPTLESAYDEKTSLACVMMDLDHFKIINDTYGHDTGDQVLLHIAHILTNNLREDDIIARWGGEEIVILLPNTTMSEASILMERIRLTLENTPLRTVKGMITVTASFGLSELIRNDTLEHLLSRADQQLFIAKQAGRNRISQTDALLS